MTMANDIVPQDDNAAGMPVELDVSTITGEEKAAILDLKAELLKIAENSDAVELQTLVYTIGKNHGYEKNMKDWFAALYQVLLGQNQGPRMGSFIALYGIKGFTKMIDQKIK